LAKQLTRSAVRIYGALSALGNGSGNVLERLLPFFEPLLRVRTGQKLAPAEFANDVRDAYKWNFNADLVEAFVPYFVDVGWIVPDIPNETNTTYTIYVPDEAESTDEKLPVEAELRDLATQFQKFANELSPLTTIPKTVEEFEDILVEWLLYTEAYSENSIEFETGFRPDASGTLKSFIDVPRSTSLRDEDEFLAARFVEHAIKTDERMGDVVARIAAIGLLTEVVQDFVKPTNAVENTDLVVYLDAPVALELLGVSGKAALENTLPVINELMRIGASIRIFEQSVEELKNNLEAMLRNTSPTGPTAQALIRGEVLRDYVVQVANNPTPFLVDLGVATTSRTLDQFPSQHQYFTDEHRSELYNALRYNENPRAREHDVSITAFVMRQRTGRSSSDLFDSKCIILTRNGLFSELAKKTSKVLGLLPPSTVPPVIHRRFFVTAIWLRTGMGASDLNIPKRMLLASCERVLAIRPRVIDAVKEATEALGDEEKTRQLDLLISQDRSTQTLMDKTLGASNVITGDNISLLFDEMLHPHLEKVRQKSESELASVKAHGRTKLKQANQQVAAVELEKSDVSAKLHAKIEEDRDAIISLCEELELRFQKQRRNKRTIGILLACASTAPIFLQSTITMQISLGIAGVILAYLTITGSNLIGIATSQKSAINNLHKLADKRRLASKLEQFEVRWNSPKFDILEPSALETPNDATTLFDVDPAH